MNRLEIADLTVDSTLKDLSLHHCQLEPEQKGLCALDCFNSKPNLPGILIIEDRQLVGMISRRVFFEQMGRPYGLELFLNRSILRLYQYNKIDHLVLSESTLITDAFQEIIKRSSHLIDEPVVIEHDYKFAYSLLDIHQLMVAHSQIFELTSSLLNNANKQLKKLAVIDPLTGIGNRRFLKQYLSRDWGLAIREGYWITLVLCDIDYFKEYNDTYGHPSGDECLKQIANLIKRNCQRKTDIVARYGGEEFVFYFLNSKASQTVNVVQKIQKDLETLNIAHSASKVSSQVTLSFGLASVKPMFGEDSHYLLELADRALYKAKEKGRNQYVMMKSKANN